MTSKEKPTLATIRRRVYAMHGWSMGEKYEKETIRLIRAYGDDRAKRAREAFARSVSRGNE